MSQDTVRQIEENIRKATEIMELGKALDRLAENRDFKQVIGKGYLQDEAVRLVHLKGDPAMQTSERQASIVSQIDAISGLMSYFRTVAFNANQAAKAIEADTEERDELLAEELNRG